jgi:hypothetical protein
MREETKRSMLFRMSCARCREKSPLLPSTEHTDRWLDEHFEQKHPEVFASSEYWVPVATAPDPAAMDAFLKGIEAEYQRTTGRDQSLRTTSPIRPRSPGPASR